jgi:hypothetical protein
MVETPCGRFGLKRQSGEKPIAELFRPISLIDESDVKPIKNPATGEEHRARIALPDGFEYKEAEMGNTVNCRVSAGDKLTFQLRNTYAQLNAFDWSN